MEQITIDEILKLTEPAPADPIRGAHRLNKLFAAHLSRHGARHKRKRN